MGRIGDILKKRRLDLDITLERAAEETMIASRYLEAIETSDFSSFPGIVYAKGFLRRYAEYLKLEEVEIQGLLIQYETEHKKPAEGQLQTEEKTTDAQATSLRSIRAKRKNLYLYSILTVFGFLVIGGILGAVIVPFLEREPRISIDPSRLLSREELKGKKLEEKQETTAKGAALSGIKPAMKGVLLEGNAFEEVWVLVQLDSGKNKDILVKAGEKIKWEAKEKICLTIGNAGAIAWKFNSNAIGTLGKAGAAKTVLFTPKKMQTVIKKEQPASISSNDERNKQGTQGIGVQNLESPQSEGNATQTTGERASVAGTASKPVSTQKTKKDGEIPSGRGNTPGTGSKQSTSVEKSRVGSVHETPLLRDIRKDENNESGQ